MTDSNSSWDGFENQNAFQLKTTFPDVEIPIIKISQSHLFMGIPQILVVYNILAHVLEMSLQTKVLTIVII